MQLNAIRNSSIPNDIGFIDGHSGLIEIDIKKVNEGVLLEYSDNGKGIPEEIKDKVFEPFFTTKRGKGGSGLGMNIVYNLVSHKLKGVIKLLPSERGVLFQIALPIED